MGTEGNLNRRGKISEKKRRATTGLEVVKTKVKMRNRGQQDGSVQEALAAEADSRG